jgi:hypothetical protein
MRDSTREILPSYRIFLLVALLIVTTLLSGCTGSKFVSNENDIKALQNVYEDGNWKFQQSSINVQVSEGGAVKLSIIGEAVEKVSGENDDIYIPIVLLPELPEYYGVEGTNSSKIKLTAYKVKGGSWSIVASIPEDKISSPQNTLENQKKLKNKQIDLNILMIDPIFTSSLPLSLPVDDGLSSIKASVEIPRKSKFTSLLTKNKSDSVKLIEIPSSVSDGKIKALAELQSESSTVWNFSDIVYKLPMSNSFRQELRNLSQWFFLGCVIVVAVWIGSEIMLKSQKESQNDFVSRQLLRDLIFNQTDSMSRYDVSRLADRTEETLFRYNHPFLREILQTIHSFEGRSTSSLRRELEPLLNYRRFYDERNDGAKNRNRFLFYTISTVLAIVALTLLVSSVVIAKEPDVSLSKPSNNSLLLGEFSININSSSYNSDKVKATLGFFPITRKASANNEESFFIQFGNEAKLITNSSKVDVKAVDPSSPIKYGIKNIQSKKIRGLDPLIAATKSAAQIDQYAGINDVYKEAIYGGIKAEFVEMEYEVSNAIIKKDQIPDKHFNWFPMDIYRLKMPIKIEGATAIFKKITIDTPVDLYSKVTQSGISGINSELKRDENQMNKYTLIPEKNKFILVNSGTELVIDGTYERSFPGKILYTYGILIIGEIIAVGIGWFSPEWKSLWMWMGALVSVIITFVALLFSNKALQSILSERGQLSLFDIFFALTIFSSICISVLAFKYKRMKKAKTRGEKIEKAMVAGFILLLPCMIPFFTMIFIHP